MKPAKPANPSILHTKGIKPKPKLRKKSWVTSSTDFKKFVDERRNSASGRWKTSEKRKITKFLKEQRIKILRKRIEKMKIEEKAFEIADKLPKNLSTLEKSFYITNELTGLIADKLGIKGTKRRKFNSISAQRIRLEILFMHGNTHLTKKIYRKSLEYAIKNLRYGIKIDKPLRQNITKQGFRLKEYTENLINLLEELKNKNAPEKLSKKEFEAIFKILEETNDFELAELMETKKNMDVFNEIIKRIRGIQLNQTKIKRKH